MEVSYTFPAEVTWEGERRAKLIMEGKPEVIITTPPEFGGPTGFISPQDLFVASAATSLFTTFVAMADKVRASFVNFSCTVKGVVEKVEDKGLVFTSIMLRPKVGIADLGEERPVKRALDLAKKYCLVTNSMSCPVEMEARVEVV